MRNRNLFLPRDVNGLSDEEEKVRVWRLCVLWNTLDDMFTQFQNDHIKDRVEGAAPYEAFFTCFTKVLRKFKNSRNKQDEGVATYLLSTRIQIYEGGFACFKNFMPVYEARFEEDFYDKLVELAIGCGQFIQMIALAMEGKFDHGTYHIQHASALRRGGLSKAVESNKAKFFVIAEWAKHSGSYNHNKSEFSRHYARRVKNELGVTVTDKTIREVWLKDTRLLANRPGS